MLHASKIEKAEGQLDFREGARTLHNKVCELCTLHGASPVSLP